METSPANRLPEADSLPDGFVDSSAEPAPSQPSDQGKDCSSTLDLDLDLDQPEETTKSTAASTVSENLDAETVALSLQHLTTSDNSAKESKNVSSAGGILSLFILNFSNYVVLNV
jgi:hypothetical protein